MTFFHRRSFASQVLVVSLGVFELLALVFGKHKEKLLKDIEVNFSSFGKIFSQFRNNLLNIYGIIFKQCRNL